MPESDLVDDEHWPGMNTEESLDESVDQFRRHGRREMPVSRTWRGLPTHNSGKVIDNSDRDSGRFVATKALGEVYEKVATDEKFHRRVVNEDDQWIPSEAHLPKMT